jgi:predicted nuclease of restriction endonuclease-like (RecB) superfamily
MMREIGLAHNAIIIEKCKDDFERAFYIKMTKKFGWTKNVVIHQIENESYQKYLLNQTNLDFSVALFLRKDKSSVTSNEVRCLKVFSVVRI